MSLKQINNFKLNTGIKIPSIGIGTFGIKSEDVMMKVLDVGLGCGYRLIDTATVYKNERIIGKCLPEVLKKHNLNREDIFITTKLSPQDLDLKAHDAVERSLNNLQLDYIDLYLIHWPGRKGKKVEDPINKDLRRKAWLSLEKVFLETDKIKNLGVSNFKLKHLKQLEEYSKTIPAVLQSELHPDYLNEEVFDYCLDKCIHYQAYSSLGQGKLIGLKRFDPITNKLPQVTLAQILLRWGLQKGCSVLPKSTNISHIIENFKINSFDLSNEDLLIIKGCAEDKKYAWDSVDVA